MSDPLHWFSAFGIELEFMIVDRTTLAVKPIADRVLRRLAGASEQEFPMQVELGPVAWSNELALHVIELKTAEPRSDLAAVARDFTQAVTALNVVLADFDARLMPTAMHPLMDPNREFQLWPVDEEGIYGSFDRIFDCRGHGWSNLQSMHVNLPFANDEEFKSLHAATRFLLPLLPALSASSPVIEGRLAPHLDERLFTYRGNARRVPSVSGNVVPESVRSRAEYETRILQTIYRDLAPFDPEGALQYEWVNARGAIARFDRMALEIRVLDAQECPRADLALAWLIGAVLRPRAMAGSFDAIDAAWAPERLASILDACVRDASQALIDDRDFLALWGVHTAGPVTARRVWRELVDQIEPLARPAEFASEIEVFIEQGTLAERIARRLGQHDTTRGMQTQLDRAAIVAVYSELCACLSEGRRLYA
ncbi:MAG TPA: glutamate-cysteine ligase family protein [Polyangiaceae bacterium]|jgi:gamma-glutamyl:cysteine ligase YbdK (ATP-grasp superfamily)|nr:glutamate-cysteine ligase family protein [Polyangiaceae bacterium]